jgi:hypothetical protein
MLSFRKWWEAVATAHSIDKPPPVVDDPEDNSDDEEWRMPYLQKHFAEAMRLWASKGATELHKDIISCVFDFPPKYEIWFYGGGKTPLKSHVSPNSCTVVISWNKYPLSEEVIDKWHNNWVTIKSKLLHTDIWRVFKTTPEQLFHILDKGDVPLFILAYASIQTPPAMVNKYIKEEGLYFFGKNQKKILMQVEDAVRQSFPNASISLKIEPPIPPYTNLYSSLSINIPIVYGFVKAV